VCAHQLYHTRIEIRDSSKKSGEEVSCETRDGDGTSLINSVDDHVKSEILSEDFEYKNAQ